MNQEKRAKRRRKIVQHRLSMIGICGVLLLLTMVLGVKSISLKGKEREYQAMEKKLQLQIEDAQAKRDELEDLEDYVGTDEYVEEVAKDKLGLAYENEILFEPEE